MILLQMGGMVLAFAARSDPSPSPETLAMVTGVITQAPLIHLTYPAAKILRYIAAGLSRVLPALPFPADMPEKVSHSQPHISLFLTQRMILAILS